MRSGVVAVLVAACAASPAARAPAAPRVLQYVTIFAGRQVGSAEVRVEPDGRRLGRSRFEDRGNREEVATELVLDDRGVPRRFRATGVDHFRVAIDEVLDDAGGMLAWRSPGARGHAPPGSGWYVALHDSGDATALLARALGHAPDHRIKLLPAGEAWIEDDTARTVAGRRLHRVAIAGLAFGPVLVWLDERDDLFAQVDAWGSSIRAGSEALIPALLADDQAWIAARAGRLARQLAHQPPAAGLAITHARVFDAERRVVVPDRTVVVVGDRITAVGDAATPVPAGAQVIDARGRTLIPGLWDMHAHVHDLDGASYLAAGVTTVRDLGNDIEELSARAARFDAGTELGPSVLRAGLIDGPGPYTPSIATVVKDAAEATAAVNRLADRGYVQIKIYGSLPPALVPVVVAAAHARGLRVSGHTPFGMTAADAVARGFDELQHVNFLFLRFLAGPTDDTRTSLRVERVAERGAELDLDGPAVAELLDLLVAHRTVLDPTLAVFHNMFTAEAGELDPVLLPFARRLPAQVERGARGGGLAANGKRAQYRASYAALLRMVKLAYDRGIPIVAGTDYYAGLGLSHELELYVQAGLPPADVLALASLGAARVMGVAAQTGSIAPGKRADLVLLNGDPTRDITAIRETDAVLCRGRLYDPAELFSAVGMRPR
jgi:hypothetical protein